MRVLRWPSAGGAFAQDVLAVALGRQGLAPLMSVLITPMAGSGNVLSAVGAAFTTRLEVLGSAAPGCCLLDGQPVYMGKASWAPEPHRLVTVVAAARLVQIRRMATLRDSF